MRIFFGLLAIAALSLGNVVIRQESPASPQPNPPQDEANLSGKNFLATIIQSGSTNTRAHRVVIYSDGSATVELEPAIFSCRIH